jgi:hypothetical protein
MAAGDQSWQKVSETPFESSQEWWWVSVAQLWRGEGGEAERGLKSEASAGKKLKTLSEKITKAKMWLKCRAFVQV